MSSYFMRRLGFVFASAAIGAGALSLSGCSESEQDAARKPSVAAMMIKDSMQHVANKGPVNGTGAAYQSRLNTILMDVDTADLETIRNFGCVIVLDQRLAEQKEGSFWSNRQILGVFYNDPQQKVISLYDDGKSYEETSSWSRDAYDYSADLLHKFAVKIRSQDISPSGENMYAGRFPAGKTQKSDWRVKSDFSNATVNNNSTIILNPPVMK